MGHGRSEHVVVPITEDFGMLGQRVRHFVTAAGFPGAALRPDAPVDAHSAAGRVRLTLAGLPLVVGPALLGVAMVQDSTPIMVAGRGSVFTGVLLLGPVLVPRLIRITGALLGPARRLATRNAVRRTAATTASLLVGVTVTSAVLTGMATASAALEEERDRQHPVDASLTSAGGTIAADLLDRVRTPPVPNGPSRGRRPGPAGRARRTDPARHRAGRGGRPSRQATAVPSSSTIRVGIARRVTPSIVVAGATWAPPSRAASTP